MGRAAATVLKPKREAVSSPATGAKSDGTRQERSVPLTNYGNAKRTSQNYRITALALTAALTVQIRHYRAFSAMNLDSY